MTYGTIKHGKVKFKLGSKQDKYLHTMGLAHTHVHSRYGKKIYVRFFPKRRRVR